MNLAAQTIRFHALRRREPHDQAFLYEAPYTFPRRRFVE